MKYIIITGAENAGKTHHLKEMRQQQPGAWLDSKAPATEWLAQFSELEQEKGALLGYKFELLTQHLKFTPTILYVDNIDKVSGRKADFLKALLLVAQSVVVTAQDEGLIPIALRDILLTPDEFEIIRLKGKNWLPSYDVTHILTGVLAIGAFTTGFYEAALIITTLGILSHGRYAAKQR
jgi:hypothetical protein